MFGEVWVRFLRRPIAVLGGLIIILVTLACILAPVLAPFDYDAQDVTRKFTEPNGEFIFGADNLGRDVFSRLLYGGRISLMVGFVSASVAAVFGVLLGGVAAFYGKKTDNIIMRILDEFLKHFLYFAPLFISNMVRYQSHKMTVRAGPLIWP